jgi:hypothetical protein
MGVMTVSSQNFMEIDMPGWWLSGASVDLDFRNGRYYDSSNILAGVSNLLSISRASVGYAKTSGGVLTQFSSGQMRITDLGLLIEDARTNYMLNSADFSQWNSSVSGSTVTTDTTVAPDGTATGDTIAFAVNEFRYGVTQSSLPISSTLTVTYSIWLMGSGTIGMRMFNASASTIVAQAVTLTSSWTNYSLTGVMDTSANQQLNVGLDNRAGVIPGLSGLAVTLQAWGGQIEAASFASSYIPTTTTSATRAADLVAVTGNLDTALEGVQQTVLLDYQGSAPVGTMQGIFVYPRSGVATINILVGASGETNARNIDSGNNNLDAIAGNARTWLGGAKAAVCWDASGRSICMGGGTVVTDANVTGLTGSGPYRLSPPTVGTFGYYRRFTAWNSRIANATLQALTFP